MIAQACRTLLCGVLLWGCGCATSPVPDALSLTREQWRPVASGDDVVALDPLRAVVKQLLDAPQSVLDISHPGTADGAQWAGQVRRWLVALGVASARLHLQAESPDDKIHLVVRTE